MRPVHRRSGVQELTRAERELLAKLGRMPTTEELARATGLTVEAVRSLSALTSRTSLAPAQFLLLNCAARFALELDHVVLGFHANTERLLEVVQLLCSEGASEWGDLA